jgi:hypothetical protein
MNQEVIKQILPLVEAMGINPQSILDGIKPEIIKSLLAEESELQKNIFITLNLKPNKDDISIKIFIINAEGNTLHKELNLDEFLKSILDGRN